MFNDFNSELGHLAVNLGAISLADKLAKDTRTEDEKIFESLQGKAETFYYAGEIDKSLNVFSSMIVLNPDDASPWNNKGNALSALGRMDEAVAAYEKALEIFESTDSPHIDMVQKRLAEIKSQK